MPRLWEGDKFKMLVPNNESFTDCICMLTSIFYLYRERSRDR